MTEDNKTKNERSSSSRGREDDNNNNDKTKQMMKNSLIATRNSLIATGGDIFATGGDILDDVHRQALTFLQQLRERPEKLLPSVELDRRTKRILWRDFLLLVGSLVALSIIGFVESNASDPDARFEVTTTEKSDNNVNPNGIVDTGYILTQPLYLWLKNNRSWNDVLAGLNSVVLVPPSLYIVFVTVWKGDYSLIFRVLAVQLLRSFCGWFTYLPPDPTYLNSHYDFPDFVHCLFRDCVGTPDAMPFVSFFSGHVATMVVAANHMWLSNYKTMSIIHHFFNGLQMIRLLATRGHYSIDIIIGWYIAIYASVPAGRMGRYYSREGLTWEAMTDFIHHHSNATEAFERMTGVREIRLQRQMSEVFKREDVQHLLMELDHDDNNGGEDTKTQDLTDHKNVADLQTETIAKLLHGRANMLYDQAKLLRDQLRERVQTRLKEAAQHNTLFEAPSAEEEETKKEK